MQLLGYLKSRTSIWSHQKFSFATRQLGMNIWGVDFRRFLRPCGYFLQLVWGSFQGFLTLWMEHNESIVSILFIRGSWQQGVLKNYLSWCIGCVALRTSCQVQIHHTLCSPRACGSMRTSSTLPRKTSVPWLKRWAESGPWHLPDRQRTLRLGHEPHSQKIRIILNLSFSSVLH